MSTVVDADGVWRQWSGRVRAFIAARVADDDVDDVLQTVFLQVHGGLAGLRDDDRLLGWLYRIARNAVADHYRAASRRRELATGELPEAVADDDPGPETSDEVRRELADCVRPIVATLAPHYRQALELTELGGMTQVAAASEVGVTVAGMKSRVQRARRQVLEALHECCVLALDARGAPIACTPRCGDRELA